MFLTTNDKPHPLLIHCTPVQETTPISWSNQSISVQVRCFQRYYIVSEISDLIRGGYLRIHRVGFSKQHDAVIQTCAKLNVDLL